MSATQDPREAEATAGPDSDLQLPVEPDPPGRPHEPGARPTPLSRLLHP